jgi:glycosyltransferase involved in cell wall biosynthesis
VRRILLLIKGLGRGGAERILVSSACHGSPSEFEYHAAFLLPWKNAFARELEENGIHVVCLDGGGGITWLGGLRTLVKAAKIDLVHAHSPVPAIGARLGIRRSIPIVYTEHNVWERYHRATYWGNLLTYPRNRHVFAVSHHVRASIRYPTGMRFLPMPPVETLYHGPDPEALLRAASRADPRAELRIPFDVPVVGCVANLKRHKGLDYLLRAAVEVRNSVPETRFVIVGAGPLEGQLKQQAQTLGVDEAVIFTGYREDAIDLASCFDVFVLASIHEGLSIALIEAMSLGKPAVVTGVGGLAEVVEDGKQGFVVPAADEASLASGIITLLRNRDLLDSFGNEARRRAEKFQMKSAIQRIESVYRELLT